jgi:agmatine/peptidylarginine deiminase
MKHLPDWITTRLIFVDPRSWKYYTQDPHDLRPVYREMETALNSLEIPYKCLGPEDKPLDIWIRDWGFVGQNEFIYRPSYTRECYDDRDVEKARRMLALKTFLMDTEKSPLVFDGGNLVHDGQTAIITKKVLTDNPDFTEAEITLLFKLNLGFERVVFIPVEPDDDVGHADGILRFVKKNVVLVNEYDDSEFTGYRRQLYECLENAGIDYIPFPWFYKNEKTGGVWSAEGCYMNFLFMAQGIIYPVFGHEKDQAAHKILGSVSRMPIKAVYSTPLARLGGVLNCITLGYSPLGPCGISNMTKGYKHGS